MLLKTLLLEPDKNLLDEISESLINAASGYGREDINFELIKITEVSKLIEIVNEQGDVQAVLISTSADEGKGENIAKIISTLMNIRPELPYYIFGDENEALEAINISDEIESFFIRQDIIEDPTFVLGYIFNDFDDRCETPFWSAYKKYVVESNDSWHTPGHSGGSSFRSSPFIKDFYDFYGKNTFASDLSVSVDFLGSLSDSSKIIGKSQAAAAYTFEVKKTYFVTNGSSTSNKIVLQTLLRKGDEVIVDRNCHRSIYHGIIQSGAVPHFLSSTYSNDFGLFTPPQIEDIKLLIKNNPNAKLLVLTGCTYEGILIDLKTIIKFAHEHNVKVFVDEAWFGYGHFHPHFRPYSAIDCGADYITHSAHKVLSAFSQASYLHVNDPDFDEDFFREIYSIYTSTSPKYQLIASLDVCHKQLEMEGFHILNRLLVYVDELKQQVSKLKNIRILTKEDFIREIPNLALENIGHDPLKILIDISKLNYSFQEIHRYFNDEIGLEIEKYTQSTFLVLLTLGGTRSKVIRLYNALKKIDDGRVKLSPAKARKKLKEIPPIKMYESPADAFFAQREHVSLVESVGRVSAGVVTPYPPGIPTIIPGQLIEQEHIDYILDMIRNSILIQGMSDGLISVKKEYNH